MINRVNTDVEMREFQRRITAEYVARGLPPDQAPSLAAVESSVKGGDLLYMDNGLAPTFAGAERICVWVYPRPADSIYPTPATRYAVQQVWGPSAVHGGILRWITKKMIALGLGNVTIGFREGSLPIVNIAKAAAVIGVSKDAQGFYWTTPNAADAQLQANNIQSVNA